jgi:hypothetical protein
MVCEACPPLQRICIKSLLYAEHEHLIYCTHAMNTIAYVFLISQCFVTVGARGSAVG